jgi:hypothetical protein
MASTPGVLSTNLTGAENDIDFTARFPGEQSDYLKVQYIDPATETATESVAVTFDPDTKITLIAITLRSVSATLSTSDEVKTAVGASPDANALVVATDKAANDGSGEVIAMAATALSSGAPDATTGGYATQDEMEDDGWKQFTDGTNYYASILVDGAEKVQGCDDATSLLKATFEWKQQYLRHGGSPLSLSGVAAD